MAQFMVMVHEDEASGAALTPAETRALLENHAAYEDQLRATAALVDGERLRPSAEARRVRGPERIENGPFADKALSAYYVVEASSLEAAVEMAKQCPAAPGAHLDVRPIESGRMVPGKTSEQGRVFAFAVLGSAPNEQGWVDVMDRIDSDTRVDAFPMERFLGGVRLQARGRGRRVVNTGGRRAVFDGPFLESKEVIGGLFFLRSASLDEAVDWAGRTAFVKHGTLEIRELWRS